MKLRGMWFEAQALLVVAVLVLYAYWIAKAPMHEPPPPTVTRRAFEDDIVCYVAENPTSIAISCLKQWTPPEEHNDAP